MRSFSKTALALLAMLVLFGLAFGIGAYRGFTAEGDQVASALDSLSAVMDTRAEMGHNLLVVARRHLPENDECVKAVKEDVQQLDARANPLSKAEPNRRLSADAKALMDALAQLDSVKADQRDYGYVTGLLPQGFAQSAKWADAEKYNQAVEEFNKRLESGPNGWVARLLGIKPAIAFDKEGEAK